MNRTLLGVLAILVVVVGCGGTPEKSGSDVPVTDGTNSGAVPTGAHHGSAAAMDNAGHAEVNTETNEVQVWDDKKDGYSAVLVVDGYKALWISDGLNSSAKDTIAFEKGPVTFYVCIGEGGGNQIDHNTCSPTQTLVKE